MTTYASRFDLRLFAEGRLARLVVDGKCDTTAVSRQRLDSVLNILLEDGGPTPQIGSTPTKAVEIQWLCAGKALSAIVEQDGYVSILAEDPTWGSAFECEFDSEESLSAEILERSRELLREMGGQVRTRPADWPRGR